jgi:hypothetical protein
VLGDVFAGIAGIFSPTRVAPYLHPQTPADLPAGLQQMGQSNARMAQQSLQDASARTRAGIVGAGAHYALAELALATPAIGAARTEASFAVASRFPTTIFLLNELGNALTGTTIPRVAIGGGGAATALGVGSRVLAEAESVPGGTEQALQALAPELESSLPAATAQPMTATPNIIDNNVLVRAVNGDPNARAAIRSGPPAVTLSQLREFLDVTSEVQQTQRAQFLLDEGIVPLSTQYGQLSNPQMANTFWKIANQQGAGDTTADAALVIHGIQSGFPIITGDVRLIGTVEDTLRIPDVTFVCVRWAPGSQ